MPLITSVRNVFVTLWNHKKKTAFGLTCVGALARYLQNRESDRRIFRGYCLQALQYGNENVLATSIPRRITVLVRDFKARSLFEKYALPLLHLAGLQVDLVIPDDYKQFTTIASVLSRKDADFVYIVGGDETVTRVLTGLLRPLEGSENEKKPSRNETRLLPDVGIFNDDTSKNSLRLQCENAMAVIRGAVKDAHVLQVKVKDADPLCILNNVHWGRFAEVEQTVPKYWYWGPFKYRFTYLWNAIKFGPPESCEADVQYIEPCAGCSKCYVPPKVRQSSWLWRLIFGKPKNATPSVDYSKVINENCGITKTAGFNAVEFILKNNSSESVDSFDVISGPDQLTETEFVREGWARCKNVDPTTPNYEKSNFFRAREAEIVFKVKEEANDNKLAVGGEFMKLADFSVRTIPKAIQLITVPTLNN